MSVKPLSHGAPHNCFGCGEANHSGLHLKFFVDDQQQIICNTSLARSFEGPPGYAHGGIIATLLDEAMSKANRQHGVTAMTRQMEIDYLRPVPLEQPITITGRHLSHQGRKHSCEAEIKDGAGTVLAQGKALFIAIDRSILLKSASRQQ
ncbi:PaaI family thioesterase [Acidobacterium sp. S8]|uniref:PaaI family thioesterase n=1 Tax=Acidobacterium sp. S8 TaxID=1641854 RepID=UPI00131C09C8|nr:PaaI family thioesterase [Acidobacterium sp. S8]